MKHKLVLGLLLSSLVSANSFAIEIHGGKLLSHKEWTKGNVVKSSTKDVTSADILKLLPNYIKQQSSEGSNWIYAWGSAYPTGVTSTPVNTDVTLYGYSHVSIRNMDVTPKTYIITSTVLASGPCPSGQLCPMEQAFTQDVVTLDQMGMVAIDRMPSITTQFSMAGTAYYNVLNEIEATDSSTHFSAPGSAGTIEVTDSKK